MTTTYYTYLKPDGTADVTTYRLPSAAANGYVLVGESTVRPKLDGMKWHEGRWAPGRPDLQYIIDRKRRTPRSGTS